MQDELTSAYDDLGMKCERDAFDTLFDHAPDKLQVSLYLYRLPNCGKYVLIEKVKKFTTHLGFCFLFIQSSGSNTRSYVFIYSVFRFWSNGPVSFFLLMLLTPSFLNLSDIFSAVDCVQFPFLLSKTQVYSTTLLEQSANNLSLTHS